VGPDELDNLGAGELGRAAGEPAQLLGDRHRLHDPALLLRRRRVGLGDLWRRRFLRPRCRRRARRRGHEEPGPAENPSYRRHRRGNPSLSARARPEDLDGWTEEARRVWA